MKQRESKHCGNCCWFYAEDTYGWGGCTHQFAEMRNCEYKCNINKFTSRQDMRHYLAVILYTRRFLRAKIVRWRTLPIVDWIPLVDRALEFAYDYIKTYSQL